MKIKYAVRETTRDENNTVTGYRERQCSRTEALAAEREYDTNPDIYGCAYRRDKTGEFTVPVPVR